MSQTQEQITQLTGKIKQVPGAEPFFLVDTGDINAADITGDTQNFPSTSLKNYLLNLQSQILEDSIEVKNFVLRDSNGIGVKTLEKGDSKNLTLYWEVNQIPTKVTINGIELENPEAGYYNVGNISSDANWTIVAANAWGIESLPMNTYVKFCNKIYCGALPKDTVITDDIIYGMTGYLIDSYDLTFTVNPKANEEIYFIAPKNLAGKIPQFSINNLIYEWNNTDYTHKTQFDNIENYVIWKHPQIIEEKITISVTGI